MKQITGYAVLVLLALTHTGCNNNSIKGSGVSSSETRKLGDFHSISLQGAMDIEYTDGPAEDVVIEAEDNFLPLIITEVKDGQLIVRQKDRIYFNHPKKITVKVTAPDIEKLSLAGSGTIHLMNDWQQDDHVKLSLSGSGDILGAVDAPQVNVALTGAGNIKLKGETKDLDVNIAGSGSFEGYNLHAENTSVSIGGSGNAEVHASVKLDVNIAGSGRVNYHGNPQVNSKTAGSGSVHKTN
ncbi:head GIN domain-containing protein [Chitinophaga sancti]|uniref:Head GIN domain-containing protein n=1 Tax=Chitinophaga sancti TaxID=1004 RepID=A0A1K1RCQ1_9BACT|nr:head GIN domain-containing protein [Chitinophaga sancti]WQD65638.1 head GIN domain-containing protein [Chitinophaga sancti]WQG88740.1 head GIN domain-containing protein [Chitinophaga sancti]SFW69943.1 Putative auto-transporter adhesin, head GIN domain [Chitinophaga sancti]